MSTETISIALSFHIREVSTQNRKYANASNRQRQTVRGGSIKEPKGEVGSTFILKPRRLLLSIIQKLSILHSQLPFIECQAYFRSFLFSKWSWLRESGKKADPAEEKYRGDGSHYRQAFQQPQGGIFNKNFMQANIFSQILPQEKVEHFSQSCGFLHKLYRRVAYAGMHRTIYSNGETGRGLFNLWQRDV